MVEIAADARERIIWKKRANRNDAREDERAQQRLEKASVKR
jgi:hypothetical protein